MLQVEWGQGGSESGEWFCLKTITADEAALKISKPKKVVALGWWVLGYH